jgi:hypothetical protein
MATVIPIERLEREAADAALRFSNVNDACPYPWHSDAAHLFKAFFVQARQQLASPEVTP